MTSLLKTLLYINNWLFSNAVQKGQRSRIATVFSGSGSQDSGMTGDHR